MPIIEPEFMELTEELDLPRPSGPRTSAVSSSPRTNRAARPPSAPDDHWIFEFMQVPSTVRYYHDKAYRDDLHRQVNEVTQQYVGKSLLRRRHLPAQPQTHRESLRLRVHLPRRQHALADADHRRPGRVCAAAGPGRGDRPADVELAARTVPGGVGGAPRGRQDAARSWARAAAARPPSSPRCSSRRRPSTGCTITLSLMRRFRDILAEKMVEFNRDPARVQRQHRRRAGGSPTTTPRSSTAELYREYCYPVLERVLDALAPGDASRYQHSDSSMGHLLDHAVSNWASARSTTARRGRRADPAKMPDAFIDGQMPPFLLRNGSPDEIEQRIVDDFRKGRRNRRAPSHHGRFAGRGHRRGPHALVHAVGSGPLPLRQRCRTALIQTGVFKPSALNPQ